MSYNLNITNEHENILNALQIHLMPCEIKPNNNIFSDNEEYISEDNENIYLSEEELYRINPIIFQRKKEKQEMNNNILLEIVKNKLISKKRKLDDKIPIKNKKIKKIKENIDKKKIHNIKQQEYRSKHIEMMKKIKKKNIIKNYIDKFFGGPDKINEIIILIICYSIVTKSDIKKEIKLYKKIKLKGENRFKIRTEKKKEYLDKISKSIFKKTTTYYKVLEVLESILI